MRPAVRSALAPLLFVVAGATRAAGAETPPASQTGAAPSFASLPEGHVPPLPDVSTAGPPPEHVPRRRSTP